MSDSAEVKIGGDVSGAQAALKGLAVTSLETSQALKNSFAAFAAASDKAAAKVKTDMGAMKAASTELVGTLKQLAGAFIGFQTVRYFEGLITGAIAANDELYLMSQRLGVSVPDLAAYNVLAQKSGMTLDGLSMGFRRLSTYMTDHGDKLKSAGITATDFNGVMLQLADLFHKLPDGALKSATGIQLLGRQGQAWIPILSQGREEMSRQLGIARELNPVTAEMAQRAHEYHDKMVELKTSLSQVWIQLSSNLLPAMKNVVNEMARGAKEGGLFSAAIAGIQAAILGTDQARNDRELFAQTEKKMDLEQKIAVIRAKGASINGFDASRLKDYQDELAKVNADLKLTMQYRGVLAKENAPPKPAAPATTKEQADAEARARRLRLVTGGTTLAPVDTREIDDAIAASKVELEQKKEFYKGEADAKRSTEQQKVEYERIAAEQQYQTELGLLQKKAKLYEDAVNVSRKKKDTPSDQQKRVDDYLKAQDEITLLIQKQGTEEQKMLNASEAMARKDVADKFKLAEDAMKADIKLSEEGLKQAQEYMDSLVRQDRMSAVERLKIEKQLQDDVAAYQQSRMGEVAGTISGNPAMLKQYQDLMQMKAQAAAASNLAIQKNEIATTEAVQKEWLDTFTPIANAFANMAKGVAMGTETLRKGLSNVWSATLGEFVNMVASMTVKWAALEAWKLATTTAGTAARKALDDQTSMAQIFKDKLVAMGFISGEAAKTEAVLTGTAARTAAESSANATSIGATISTAMTKIGAYLAEAFAAEVAFLAPVMGPFAVPAAIALDAMALGEAHKLMSFDVGTGYVPRDMIAQVHKGEAIIPAAFNPAAGGFGGDTHHYNFNVQTIDAGGVKKFIMNNTPALAQGMRYAVRSQTSTAAYNPLYPT